MLADMGEKVYTLIDKMSSPKAKLLHKLEIMINYDQLINLLPVSN